MPVAYGDLLGEMVTEAFGLGAVSTGLITAFDFESLDPDFQAWVKERTFQSRLLQEEYIQTQLDGYLKSFLEGDTFEKFQDSINDLLGEAGVTPLKPYHVETIFRLEAMTAANYGRYQEQQRNLDIATLWEFVYINDDNHVEGTVCFDIAEKGGFIAPATDKIWKRIYPPNHFGCRSCVVAVPNSVAKKKGIKATGKYKGSYPDEAFDGMPWDN